MKPRPVKRTPTSSELEQLGGILARFCQDPGVTYWGHYGRPYNDGQEGGMTIDNSIKISTAELNLLDDLFDPWP